MTELSDLSEREQEILTLVATGASNKEIAQQLYISANTVKVHLRNIFTKLEVSSRTEATMWAVRNGLVQPFEGRDGAFSGEDGDEGAFVRQEVIVEGGGWRSWLRPWVLLLAAVLLVAGGIGLNSILQGRAAPTPAATEPLTGEVETRWQSKASLPTLRSSMAVAVLENAIYVVAGQSDDGATGALEVFYPETDTWASLAEKPLAVSEVQAGVVGGKIFVPGGRLSSGEVTDVLEAYDPRTDTWELAAPMPQPLSAYALVPFEGRLYLFGGWNGEKFVNDAFAYDPDLNRWEALTSMPSARGYTAAALAGGDIFVMGGKDETGASALNEIYGPSLEGSDETPWSQGSPLPEARFAMGAAGVLDVVYLIGGENDKGGELPPLRYQTEDGRWQTFELPFTGSWSRLGVAILNSRLYAIGGGQDGQPGDLVYEYQAIYTVVLPVFIR